MNHGSPRPVVSLVKSDGHYEGTKKALSLIDDQIEKSIRGKKRVVIKPNFVQTSSQLASTHVDSVRAVMDVIAEHYHGKLTIGEGPAIGGMESGISNFGYDKLRQEHDVDFIDLNYDEYAELEGVDRHLKPLKFRFSKTVLECDYLISVAKPKTHDCVITTLSIKNVVVGSLVKTLEKKKIHQGIKAINLNIAKLAEHCMPHLAVVDGYVGMEGRGPVRGDRIDLGASAASLHPVSLDAVMSTVMGFQATDIGYLHHLNTWGKGVSDLRKIQVIGEPIKNVTVKFRPHPTYEEQLRWR